MLSNLCIKHHFQLFLAKNWAINFNILQSYLELIKVNCFKTYFRGSANLIACFCFYKDFSSFKNMNHHFILTEFHNTANVHIFFFNDSLKCETLLLKEIKKFKPN